MLIWKIWFLLCYLFCIVKGRHLSRHDEETDELPRPLSKRVTADILNRDSDNRTECLLKVVMIKELEFDEQLVCNHVSTENCYPVSVIDDYLSTFQ